LPKKNNKSGLLLSKNLRSLRKLSGLTQERVAEIADISYKYYQSIEGNRHTNLQLKTLDSLADLFGVSTFELIHDSPPNQQVLNTYASKDFPLMKAAEDAPKKKTSRKKKPSP
jgi:transcriptional regulator with XRE-family HTH domain